jgi:ABC-type hemin transport system substrate-binding protein
MTDSLYELGAGGALVGVTMFCPQPLGPSRQPARLGGTHDFDVEAVINLEPDLVIANQEENPKGLVRSLEKEGLNVWVTFPKTAYEAIHLLYTLARLFRLPQAVARIQTMELTLDWTESASPEQRSRVFSPIWLHQASDGDPWYMSFNGETYAHDVIWRCHGSNIFSQRVRRYPLEADLGRAESEPPGDRDTRYPRVTPEEIQSLLPEIVLLPSEPFPFGEMHIPIVREHLAGTPAVEADRIHLVDGRLITWHGTRLASALSSLPQLLQA